MCDKWLTGDKKVDDRIIVSGNYVSYRDGKILLHFNYGEVEVPPIRERWRIIYQASKAVGYTSGDRLYSLLRERYWWHGMRNDCVVHCANSKANQIERAHFLNPPYLLPTYKGL